MSKYKFIIIFYFLSYGIFSQINPETKRTNWWYFGQGAGIDWSSGSPVGVSNGQTNSYEGASSISDLNGNLLFYSDGNTIWNKNHVPMQGGNNLLGCDNIPTIVQVSQNALIIPHPGNDSLYYLFHLGCLDFQLYTLKYTVINVKLNNGLGKVISANSHLTLTKAQGLTACRHSDGCSTWIVCKDTSNNYNFFKFSNNGLSLSPTVNISPFGKGNPNSHTTNFKFSNDLSMMAEISFREYNFDTLAIFKFNNASGTLSNCVKIEVNHGHVYGLCFSPDNSKLYTGSEFFGDIILPPLYQYDLSNYSETIIQNSKYLVYQDSAWHGHMQLGPDNKIYFARGTAFFSYGNADSIGVINNPNLLGSACGLNLNAVYLAGKQSIASLPNFDQGYFYPQLNNTCVTSIEEINKHHFIVFPNPAVDFLNIENTEGFNFEFQIIDINGKVALMGYLNSFETKRITLDQLTNGIYILLLKNNNTIINYKLIKN